jgi:uncharacterized membrane protein
MNCSEIQIQTIKYVSLGYLSLFILILGFINTDMSSDSKDEKTKDVTNAVNICSSIIMFLCFVVLLRCAFFFYMTRTGDSVYQEIDIVNKLLIFVFPLCILVVSIIQKVYVSNYLPDMKNRDEVEKFNKTHRVNAETINSSINTLLLISIILFISSLIYAYITSKPRN